MNCRLDSKYHRQALKCMRLFLFLLSLLSVEHGSSLASRTVKGEVDYPSCRVDAIQAVLVKFQRFLSENCVLGTSQMGVKKKQCIVNNERYMDGM